MTPYRNLKIFFQDVYFCTSQDNKNGQICASFAFVKKCFQVQWEVLCSLYPDYVGPGPRCGLHTLFIGLRCALAAHNHPSVTVNITVCLCEYSCVRWTNVATWWKRITRTSFYASCTSGSAMRRTLRPLRASSHCWSVMMMRWKTSMKLSFQMTLQPDFTQRQKHACSDS